MSGTDAPAWPVTDDAVERHRLETLDATGLLTERSNEYFEHVTRLARRLLAADTALVSLVGEDRQGFPGHDGLDPSLRDESGSPIAHSFCRYAVASGEPFVIDDARRSPLLRESPAIAERNVVAYAGVPLRVHTGEVLGTLCVIHSSPRDWTDHDIALLDELAALVRTEIDHRLRLKDVEEVETLALRLPEPVGRLSDVVRTTASLVERPGDPRLPRMADVARERLATVEAVTQDLARAVGEHRRHIEPVGPVEVDLASRVRRTLRLLQAASRPEDVRASVPDAPVVVTWPAARLDRALSSLLLTAMLHMDEHGVLTVDLVPTEDGAHLTVVTPGPALPVTDLLRVVSVFAPEETEVDPVDVSARRGVTRVRNRWAAARSGGEGTTVEVSLPRGTAGAEVPGQRTGAR